MSSSSFKAVAGADARVLILGSLPGAASLACGEYYAQAGNAFWRIMAELVGAAPTLPYNERLQRMVAARIALWDVCARATRTGSLDAAIQVASVVPNDIPGFLRSHPNVRLICFNGAKAADLFRRLVVHRLGIEARKIAQLTLPSTSPAHAAMPFDEKLRAWRMAVAAPDA
jgi:TDG/mug DNA glycosylase family protein